jgi:hypothetical protein
MAEIMLKWIEIMSELSPWRWLWIRTDIGRDVQAIEEEEPDEDVPTILDRNQTELITRELPAITIRLEVP